MRPTRIRDCKMKKICLVVAIMVCCGIHVKAQRLRDLLVYKTTINVIPDHAQIFIGSAEVATGTYEYTFKTGEEYIMVKLLAPGFVEKNVRVNRTDRTSTHKLDVDDAWSASEVSADVANRPLRVIVKRGMDSDDVWRRISYYISEVFPNIEITDRTVGWVRSAYNIQNFNNSTIRTRFEVREIPGQDEITFRLTLSSEIAPRNCGLSDQCFSQWDRALKTYIQFLEDFRAVLSAL